MGKVITEIKIKGISERTNAGIRNVNNIKGIEDYKSDYKLNCKIPI